jgi:hypothetical protein
VVSPDLLNTCFFDDLGVEPWRRGRSATDLRTVRGDEHTIPYPVPERAAAWRVAVSAGSRADAGVRDHGFREPGTRFAVHDRGVFLRHADLLDRLVHACRSAGAGGHGHRRAGGGNRCDTAFVSARSPGPRAGDVRFHSDCRYAGTADLGTGRDRHSAARGAAGASEHPARGDIPDLPAGDHCRRPAGGARVVPADQPHPAGHADPGRRVQPHDGLGAGHRHQDAVLGGFCAGRSAGRAWPAC